uniref:Uncharacterized protein n=1 Tax=Arundo donax TaxID=35708 RepID=A0A0A9GPD1_ARUDO
MRGHVARDVDPVAPLELGAVPQQPLGLVGLEQPHDAALAPLVALLRRRGRQRRRVGVWEAVHGAAAENEAQFRSSDRPIIGARMAKRSWKELLTWGSLLKLLLHELNSCTKD